MTHLAPDNSDSVQNCIACASNAEFDEAPSSS